MSTSGDASSLWSMPDQLDPDYYRREAQRLRLKATSQSNATLRKETLQIAEQMEALATEVERYLRDAKRTH